MATRPTQFRPFPARTKADRDRDHDRKRLSESETRRLYGSARWKRRRADQLRAHPLCAMCLDRGHIAPATVADHVEPHGGDVDKFWTGELKSLCAHDHNSIKQREEAAARGRGA